MTDSQIIHITEINRGDIVNGTYRLNISDEQIDAVSDNICIAVIGRIDPLQVRIFKGESFDSLRLFRDTSLAEKYIVTLLSGKSPYAYVQVQIQEIGQKMGRINNTINSLLPSYKDSYGDIVVNCLKDATDVEEFYNQEIEEIKYIINSDLTYSSALLYINALLYIDLHRCCVCWRVNDGIGDSDLDLMYWREETLEAGCQMLQKVASLNELAQKAYNESRGKL